MSCEMKSSTFCSNRETDRWAKRCGIIDSAEVQYMINEVDLMLQEAVIWNSLSFALSICVMVVVALKLSADGAAPPEYCQYFAAAAAAHWGRET